MEKEENMKDLVGQSDEVCQKLHVKKNDFNYLKKGLDNVIKHVVQGEKLFEDYQVEHQNLDHLFHDLNQEVSLLEREKKAVQTQLKKMECGKGVSF
jgi:hypothetical protein